MVSCLARCYTTQSRLLRVYMSTKRPGIKTTILALYILAVYVLTVITMKNRPDMVEAQRHLFEELQRRRRYIGGHAAQSVWERAHCAPQKRRLGDTGRRQRRDQDTGRADGA